MFHSRSVAALPPRQRRTKTSALRQPDWTYCIQQFNTGAPSGHVCSEDSRAPDILVCPVSLRHSQEHRWHNLTQHSRPCEIVFRLESSEAVIGCKDRGLRRIKIATCRSGRDQLCGPGRKAQKEHPF